MIGRSQVILLKGLYFVKVILSPF